ncbi:MAG: O-antigen ligase family protein [Acidobacteria bacterium]|nr:O-antigen ligase family protein [Acidobacteriota bacterium]MBI3422579.1 O-antigen ligase family protein [Acidobacteriota bacterium]
MMIATALFFGAVLASFGGLPIKTLAGVFITVGGLLGVLAWAAASWPIVPILRVLLLACLAFRLEINLFPLFKYNEGLPGLNVSLMLLTSIALVLAHGLARWRDQPAAAVFPVSFSFSAFALLLWCALGILAGTEKLLAFYAWWSLASCLLFTFAVANEFGQRDRLRTVVLVIALIVGVNGVIGTLQATTGALTDLTWLGAAKEENRQSFGDGEIARATGLQGMANSFAWFLVTLLPTLLAVLILRVRAFSRWERRGLALATAAGLLALLLTYARGSWIAFALAFALLLALSYRVLPTVERQRFGKQIAMMVLLGCTLCLPFLAPIVIRLTEDDNGSAYSRVPLSQVAQTMIEANPLLGVGLSNYEAEMRRYDHTPDRITEDFPWPVHNIFLHTAAEAGLPGLAFFLLLLALALYQGWQVLRSQDRLVQALAIGLICGVLAYLVTGLKELGSLGTPQFRVCFFCCGLLLALGRIHRHDIYAHAQELNY